MRRLLWGLGLFSGCILFSATALAQKQPPSSEVVEGSIVNVDSECDAVPGNLVRNCGFEMGSFAMWTQFGDLSFTGVTMNPTYVHSGSWGMQVGPVDSLGGVSQNLTTVAGQTYKIIFQMRNVGAPNQFAVFWDGALVMGNQQSLGDFGYTQFVIGPVRASGTTTQVAFAFFNPPDFFGLDDVIVFGEGGGGGACTQVMNPGDGTYLTTTGLCDLGMSLFADTSVCRNRAGAVAGNLVGPVNVRHAGVAGWLTWSMPPFSESPTPWVGFAPGAQETVTLVDAAATAGFEAEPNLFQVFDMTVVFQDAGGAELARITRSIDGSAGARLFAVTCDSPVISKIIANISPAAQGFAIGQIRSNRITGGASGDGSDVPVSVPPNATSNIQ